MGTLSDEITGAKFQRLMTIWGSQETTKSQK
jgi:hypothetical protein